MEEPPEHVIFILATTEPDKILPTIISRCQRYDFKSLTYTEVKDKLSEICRGENVEIDEGSLGLIYESSGGSMRDAISILEKSLTYTEVKDKLSEICRGENVEIDEGSLGLIYESSGGSMRDAISILERVIITYLGEKIDEDKCSKVIGITSKTLLKEFLGIVKGNRISEGAVFLDKLWLDSLDIEKFFKDFGKYIKNLVLSGEMEAEEGLKIIGNIFDSLNKFKYEEDKRLLGYVVLNSLIKKADKGTKEVVVEKQIVYKEVPKVSQEKNGTENKISEKTTTEYQREINIDEIKEKWSEIVRAAKNEKMTFSAFLMDAAPYRIEDNILYIKFNSNLFAKEQMETEYYNSIFQDVVERITGFLMDAAPYRIEDNILYIKFNSNLFAKEQMETEYYNSIFQDVVERITGLKIRTKYIFKENNKSEKSKSDNDLASQLMTYFSEEN